jgi:hypothetical protein
MESSILFFWRMRYFGFIVPLKKIQSHRGYTVCVREFWNSNLKVYRHRNLTSEEFQEMLMQFRLMAPKTDKQLWPFWVYSYQSFLLKRPATSVTRQRFRNLLLSLDMLHMYVFISWWIDYWLQIDLSIPLDLLPLSFL